MLKLITSATIASALLAFAPTSASATVPPSPAKGKAVPAGICHEDEPCFIWSTMGNLQRGVVTVKGAPRIGQRIVVNDRAIRVVTPCEFAYADMLGFIDWKRTPRLRGDMRARKHGCNPYLYA